MRLSLRIRPSTASNGPESPPPRPGARSDSRQPARQLRCPASAVPSPGPRPLASRAKPDGSSRHAAGFPTPDPKSIHSTPARPQAARLSHPADHSPALSADRSPRRSPAQERAVPRAWPAPHPPAPASEDASGLPGHRPTRPATKACAGSPSGPRPRRSPRTSGAPGGRHPPPPPAACPPDARTGATTGQRPLPSHRGHRAAMHRPNRCQQPPIQRTHSLRSCGGRVGTEPVGRSMVRRKSSGRPHCRATATANSS